MNINLIINQSFIKLSKIFKNKICLFLNVLSHISYLNMYRKSTSWQTFCEFVLLKKNVYGFLKQKF